MGEDDGETSDAPSTDRAATASKRCEYCESAIDTSDWYPVTKERDSDGSLQLYPFCSEDCQGAWLDGGRDRPSDGRPD